MLIFEVLIPKSNLYDRKRVKGLRYVNDDILELKFRYLSGFGILLNWIDDLWTVVGAGECFKERYFWQNSSRACAESSSTLVPGIISESGPGSDVLLVSNSPGSSSSVVCCSVEACSPIFCLNFSSASFFNLRHG